jgi:hypothetical protein
MKKFYALAISTLFTGFAFAQKTFTEPVKVVPGHSNDINQVTVSSRGG